MEINLDLIQLFRQIGVPASAFDPVFATAKGDGVDDPLYRTDTGVYGSPYYAFDANGREYFLPVTVSYPVTSQGATSIDGFGGGPQSTLKDWQLPYPVISIRVNKKIIETELTERRGTVDELVNIGSYEITIRGFIINSGNEFPEQDVITLRTLFECNAPVSIKCPLTDIFLLRADRSGSDQVVIRSLDFPEIAGVKNVRHYTLTMKSSEPFNLVDIS